MKKYIFVSLSVLIALAIGFLKTAQLEYFPLSSMDTVFVIKLYVVIGAGMLFLSLLLTRLLSQKDKVKKFSLKTTLIIVLLAIGSCLLIILFDFTHSSSHYPGWPF